MTPAERAKQIVDENTAAGSARLDRLVDAIAAALTVPANHVRDEHGNDMRVLGTLPKTADGVIVGDCATVWITEGPDEPIASVSLDKCGYSCSIEGFWPIEECYSTRAAALAAKNGGGE